MMRAAALSTSDTVSVLVVDDHAIIRCGLRQILEDTHDLRVCGEAENGAQALQAVRHLRCDAAVMDISMPDRDGIETLKLLKKEQPRLPVIMLSMYPEEHYAVRALKAGAAGYLSKTSAADHLVTAIRTVVSGRKYVSATVAEHLANAITDHALDSGPSHEKLSDREYQTLCLIATGHTLTEIAERLKLSVKTVSVYRSRILEKMKLRTNAELTHYGLKNGLVSCEM